MDAAIQHRRDCAEQEVGYKNKIRHEVNFPVKEKKKIISSHFAVDCISHFLKESYVMYASCFSGLWLRQIVGQDNKTSSSLSYMPFLKIKMRLLEYLIKNN